MRGAGEVERERHWIFFFLTEMCDKVVGAGHRVNIEVRFDDGCEGDWWQNGEGIMGGGESRPAENTGDR